jgi:hypothetical protein
MQQVAPGFRLQDGLQEEEKMKVLNWAGEHPWLTVALVAIVGSLSIPLVAIVGGLITGR